MPIRHSTRSRRAGYRSLRRVRQGQSDSIEVAQQADGLQGSSLTNGLGAQYDLEWIERPSLKSYHAMPRLPRYCCLGIGTIHDLE